MSYEDYSKAVKIDDCHIDLIYGLIVSQKPNSVLELGWGSGKSAHRIFEAITYNDINENRYLIVDNWMDFDRKRPVQSNDLLDEGVQFLTSEEGDFIKSCTETFDFILSDADHCWSHLWFERTFNEILRPGGIMVCHDVLSEGYPRLYDIVTNCQQRKISHKVFSKSSRTDERCDRGLLVIFKD